MAMPCVPLFAQVIGSRKRFTILKVEGGDECKEPFRASRVSLVVVLFAGVSAIGAQAPKQTASEIIT